MPPGHLKVIIPDPLPLLPSGDVIYSPQKVQKIDIKFEIGYFWFKLSLGTVVFFNGQASLQCYSLQLTTGLGKS